MFDLFACLFCFLPLDAAAISSDKEEISFAA